MVASVLVDAAYFSVSPSVDIFLRADFWESDEIPLCLNLWLILYPQKEIIRLKRSCSCKVCGITPFLAH